MHAGEDSIMRSESVQSRFSPLLTARLAEICDSVSEIVYWARPDGYCAYLNQAFYKHTGFLPHSAEGQDWETTLHPEDKEPNWERWLASKSTGRPYTFCFRLRRHDGTYRWFEGRSYPLHNPQNEIALWVGLSYDIEDRIRTVPVAVENSQVMSDKNGPGGGAIFEVIDLAGRQFEVVRHPKIETVQLFDPVVLSPGDEPGWKIRKLASLPPDPRITAEIALRVQRLADLFSDAFAAFDGSQQKAVGRGHGV
jgi:PAS domain S-box-containing protein